MLGSEHRPGGCTGERGIRARTNGRTDERKEKGGRKGENFVDELGERVVFSVDEVVCGGCG